MYNPRHSYLSTGTTNTYPSTLSANATIPYPPTPPISPQKPNAPSAKLHRSSKRNLRTSASIASLNPIKETVDRESRRKTKEDGDVPERKSAGSNRSPGSDQCPADHRKDAPRPASAAATPAHQSNTADIPTTRAATARPPSIPQIQPRPSTERLYNTTAPLNPTVGLGIALYPPLETETRTLAPQVVAKPKKPKPIDVNPRKQETESMADEWERELIHSARNFTIGDSRQTDQDEGKGKGKGVDRDVEWERAGSWQADVDPLRDAEDRMRRDAKGERAFPPSAPRAPIRAAPNGVTSVHVGVRPRLHPNRANSSMSLNQPDQTLAMPIGSPLGESQAHNLSTGRIKPGERNEDPRLKKAQAEYEAWLAKKDERESGVGHPHDYGTRDWAAKGRVPARPAVLDRMNSESFNMAQVAQPIPIPPGPPTKVQPPITKAAPELPTPTVPIIVHAVENEQSPPVPVVITPDYPVPHRSSPAPHDPAFLGEPHEAGPGNLSNRSSMNDLHSAYLEDQSTTFLPGIGGEHVLHPGMDPITAWGPYQYPYPYDPSFNYAMDPTMFQQHWNPSNSWYGPRYEQSGGYYPAPGDDNSQQALYVQIQTSGRLELTVWEIPPSTDQRGKGRKRWIQRNGPAYG